MCFQFSAELWAEKRNEHVFIRRKKNSSLVSDRIKFINSNWEWCLCTWPLPYTYFENHSHGIHHPQFVCLPAEQYARVSSSEYIAFSVAVFLVILLRLRKIHTFQRVSTFFFSSSSTVCIRTFRFYFSNSPSNSLAYSLSRRQPVNFYRFDYEYSICLKSGLVKRSKKKKNNINGIYSYIIQIRNHW